jgi:hypothetical protein
VYLFFFSALAMVMVVGYFVCLSRWAPRNATHAFKPWNTVLLLVPPLLIGVGVEIGGFGVECRLGCASYAAYGASISYIAGSLSSRMYTALAMTLVICPLTVLLQLETIGQQRINAAQKKVDFADPKFMQRASKYEVWLKIGCVFMVVTGIIPTQGLNCDPWMTNEQDHGTSRFDQTMCYNGGGYWVETILHGLGVNVAFIVFTICATRRVLLAAREHPDFDTFAKLGCGITSRKIMLWFGLFALYTAALHLIFWLCVTSCAGTFVIEHNAPRNERCILYTSREACVGADFTAKQQNAFGDKYRCRWDDTAAFGVPACILNQCNKNGILTKNRLGIVGEYLGFVFFALGSASLVIWIQLTEEEAFELKEEKAAETAITRA